MTKNSTPQPMPAPQSAQPDVRPLLRLSTRRGWEAWCNLPAHTPPTLPSRKEYDAWTDDERLAFNQQRVAWHSDFVFVNHSQVQRITRRLDAAMLANRMNDGAGAGVAVTGPPHAGKTTLIRMAARHHYRRALAKGAVQQNPNAIPVVHVECPATGGPKPLAVTLANFVGAPWGNRMDSRSFDHIEGCLFASLEGCDPLLIVIDEIQRLKGDSHGRDAARFLKRLSNNFPRTTFLVAGINLNLTGPFAGEEGEQNRIRFSLAGLNPFTFGRDADHTAWTGIVQHMEQNIRLFNHKPGDLTRHSDYLLARCGGLVGTLARLVREAALMAMLDGTERITKDLLEELDPDPDDIFADENDVKPDVKVERRNAAKRKKAS